MRIVLLLFCGCAAVTPPPIMPRHRGTAAMPEGTTTVSLVVGAATQPLADNAYGIELRVAHQATPDTSYGAGLAIGTTKVDVGENTTKRVWLGALRGYADFQSLDRDWLGGTLGAGLAVIPTTGLVGLTLDAGFALSHPDDVFVPYASGCVALALPLRRGEEFGYEEAKPATAIYLGGSLGFALTHDAHMPSLETFGALDLRGRAAIFGASAADAYVP